MLQYLLNTSAIWLISLVLFDVFLRRESYHGYNRFYLLFTFLLGALLPLWQWQDDSPLYNGALQRPVEGVISAKETIVAAASPSATSFNWELYLRYAYIAGALVSLILLLAEIIKLIRLYKTGNRYREGSCMIIETGKDYSPFSIFNYVFVSSKSKYNDEEWQTIIAHEQMHGLLFHFIDVLLMQLARIVFWFHPLVYVYQKRLLMQHEYQADRAGKAQPQLYGKFLIEQALLQAAPSVTHSFNRSPIKNRIVMLTRKSTATARTKMLVFIPLALVCIVCFTKNVFSQKFVKNGNVVTYKGNRFEMSKDDADTIMVIDSATEEFVRKMVRKYSEPIKMNGKPITNNPDQKPYFASDEKNLRAYLLKNLQKEFSGLKDGQYSFDINNVVVDDHGKIVYFEYQDVKRYKPKDEQTKDPSKNTKTGTAALPDIIVTIDDTSVNGGKPLELFRDNDPANFEAIDKRRQKALFDKVCKLMDNAPMFKPGSLSGKNVVSLYVGTPFWPHVTIEHSKISNTDENTF